MDDTNRLGRRVIGWLRRRRVEVHFGSEEARAWLARRGAEAATYEFSPDPPVVFFRDPSPALSALLEEAAHVSQILRKHFADCDLVEQSHRREIEVKECLDANADRLALPESERQQTRALLLTERAALERRLAWGRS